MSLNGKKAIKTIVLILFMIIATFEGLFFYVNGQVQPESYERQILEAIKKQTGQTVKIKGIRFSLLPSPKLIISELLVGAENYDGNAGDVPVFHIQDVEIGIAFSSILSDKIELSSVNLINPTLLLKRSSDNLIHWGWLNTRLLKAINSKNGMALPLNVIGGSIKYEDSINSKKFSIEEIEAHSLLGSQMAFTGSMLSANHRFSFAIDSNIAASSIKESEFPINIQISEGSMHILKIQSIIEPSGDLPKVSGKFDFATPDIDNFLNVISKINNKAAAAANQSPSPVSISGSWNLEGEVVNMSDVAVDGLNSKGKGSISLAWEKWYPTVAVDMDFDYVDYLVWKKLLDRRIVNRVQKKSVQASDDEDETPNYDFRRENPLPEDIEVRLDINAQKVLFDKEEWKNTKLSAVLDNGTFTINQCDISLSGDGILSIFGVVSQGGTGELRFEGNMEANGNSLHKAISMFYSSAKDLPPIAMGEFNVRANMYITAGQIRLFETIGSIDSVPVEGTITIYMESVVRIDTAIKLKNVNFDYVRDTLRQQKLEETARGKKKADAYSFGFDWLKYLSIRLDAKVVIEGFNFMENQGDKASFSIYAYRGDLRVSDMQMVYPDWTDEINFNLDARGKVPFINMMLNVDKIDTGYFNINPASVQEVAVDNSKQELLQRAFLEKAVPLEWMDSFNGIFDITLRKLVHKNLIMDRIKFQAKLDNKKMVVQKFWFVFSQAQSYVVGNIFGGKVPGINVSFTMANADLYEILQPMTGLTNISGFANLSGNISTSGWNFLEWLQHSDSKVMLTARGVKVQGINLAGVTNVVDVARSSADVFNNVNNVLTKGTSEFAVDGSLNIKDGELRSPGLGVRSGAVTGNVIGGMKLENMNGQFSITFNFPNLSPDNIPNLRILLADNMNKPEIKVDTRDLEEFVAKRNVIK